MGLYRTRNCFSYAHTLTPSRPTVELTAETPTKHTRISFQAPIDTGFSGYVLLPFDEYSKLSETELLSDYFLTYNTVLGPVVLRRSPVILEIFGKRLPSFIETPVAGAGTRLVGRRIMAGLRVAMMGPESQVCVLEATG